MYIYLVSYMQVYVHANSRRLTVLVFLVVFFFFLGGGEGGVVGFIAA